MKDNDIKELNKALKGEHMAIESFDHFILECKDSTARQKLQDIQKQHKMQAIKISERIQQLNGNPVNSSGILGTATEVKFNINSNKYTTNEVVNAAIEGEKMGVDALNTIASKLSDPTNVQLIKDLSTENATIIQDLNTQV